MKRMFLAALGISLFLIGCGEKSGSGSSSTNSTSSGNPLNAPGDYLNALAKGEQKAIGTVDVASLTKAIQMFQVDKGRLPKDLNELVTEKFIPKMPEAPPGSKIVYDATSGTVKVVKQ